MPHDDDARLTPADPVDLEQALVHALQFDGKKTFRASREYIAKLTASHLLQSLIRSGYVVMKRPPPRPSLAKDCAYGTSARRVMGLPPEDYGSDELGEAGEP